MKISRSKLKELVRETMIEENEYQEFFKKALEKTGKSIPDMSDEEKKSFFNKIDTAWKSKGEKKESANKSSDKVKNRLSEGSDWILLNSIGKTIDSYSAVLMDTRDQLFGDEIEPNDKEWIKLYKKASSKDKKIMDTIKNSLVEERSNKSFGKSVNEDGKLQGGEKDPCWKGYEMVGMKKGKGGKEVPNCVPKNESKSTKLTNIIKSTKKQR